MPRPKAIPDVHTEAVLERAGRGESGAQIASWLSKKLGRSVAPQRVNELLERIRKERAPAAKAVIAEKVSKTVGSDLDALQEMFDEVGALKARMELGGDLRGAIVALREKHSLVRTRLQLSGGGELGAPINIVDPYAEPKKKR